MLAKGQFFQMEEVCAHFAADDSLEPPRKTTVIGFIGFS